MEKSLNGGYICKIRAQLGFPPTEIHVDLQKVYGYGAFKICYSLQVGMSF